VCQDGDIPFQRNITVCDRNHGQLKLFGGGTKSQEEGHDIVDTWVGVQNNLAFWSHLFFLNLDDI
jgi:hypothetical protein